MQFFNKNFWKFTGGFLCVVVLSLGALWTFQSWQSYKEEEAMKTLMREIEELQRTSRQSQSTSTPYQNSSIN